MKLIGLEKAGFLLVSLNNECLPHCEEVKVAIPYAEYGNRELLIFEEAERLGKPIMFFGRIDGTCPIDPKVLLWFLTRQEVNADIECRLVPHWLHAKVIWWVGVGAYIGSANLTDRAWNQNHEAGVFLSQEELDTQGLTERLDGFFDQVDVKSIPLDDAIYHSQRNLNERLREARNAANIIQKKFEDTFAPLSDRSSPISHQPNRSSFAQRGKNFVAEWNETLTYLRRLAARVASPENRPSWIREEIPAGVQCDQFLHAYYYNVVAPRSEKNAYLTHYERNKSSAEISMRAALA